MFFGQKDHAHAVLTQGGELHTLVSHVLAKQGVWQLHKQARTVAHQGICTDRPSMIKVFEDLKALLDDGMRLLASNMGDKTDPTSIMLMCGIVKTKRGDAHPDSFTAQ
jgi:hypothetical protein